MRNVTNQPEPTTPRAADHLSGRTWDSTVGGHDEIIVRGDAQGTILFVSESCRAMGYDPKELIGLSAEALVHPEDREKFRANTASIFNPEIVRPADRLHRYRRADGSWVWLEGHPTVLPGHDGRRGDILNIFRVVTEMQA
jgi:PAS domain S-box-containing protein